MQPFHVSETATIFNVRQSAEIFYRGLQLVTIDDTPSHVGQSTDEGTNSLTESVVRRLFLPGAAWLDISHTLHDAGDKNPVALIQIS